MPYTVHKNASSQGNVKSCGPVRHRKGHVWSECKERVRSWACRFPDTIAGAYSEALRAVGAVYAAHSNSGGWCEKSEAEIADVAGCCVTTVQNFLYWGVRTGHIQVIRRPVYDRFGNRLHRNLTNRVRIVSKVWLKWLRQLAELAKGGFKNPRSSKLRETSFFIRPATLCREIGLPDDSVGIPDTG